MSSSEATSGHLPLQSYILGSGAFWWSRLLEEFLEGHIVPASIEEIVLPAVVLRE
jgi:hypothetical protein